MSRHLQAKGGKARSAEGITAQVPSIHHPGDRADGLDITGFLHRLSTLPLALLLLSFILLTV